MVEIGVDKNTTVVFPAPLMSTIGELGAFLTREKEAAASVIAQEVRPEGLPATTARKSSRTSPAPRVEKE
jgi:hypothetical protein